MTLNWELGVHVPVALPVSSLFSFHLSGIMNGLTHVIAFAGDASAVAGAAVSTQDTPNRLPTSVRRALSRAVVRYTFTRTRFGSPAGSFGNDTSDGSTLGAVPITMFFLAVAMATWTAGPVAVRSIQLSRTSATAPASAPASAAFWACDRAVMNMPTSMASVDAAMNVMKPMAR